MSQPYDFSDLSAVFIGCTLKPSPQVSNTEALMAVGQAIMRKHGVAVEQVRAVDHHLAPGVYPDMTEHGADRDDWPPIAEQVLAADILVLGTPIWLGDKSSVCTRVVERLYAMSGQLNEAGQYAFYGKVGGVVVTGNEDGIKHVRDERPVLPPAPRLLHPAPSRRGLDRRGRARSLVPRRRIRRAAERVHP
ncbi:MAG TPA: NAD(P)H-dependent oxidoreductase, partial [Jiangellales bacterium]|nr:NAD(P)H-dependent oxidoreductase [Jiangellales bacterium]